MPAALVQSTSEYVSDGVLAYPGSVTIGNLLVVVTTGRLSATSTISDTRLTAYTKVPQLINGEGSSVMTIWYGAAPSSGANTVTIGTPESDLSLHVHEYSGIDLSVAAVVLATDITDTDATPEVVINLIVPSMIFAAWGDHSTGAAFSSAGAGFLPGTHQDTAWDATMYDLSATVADNPVTCTFNLTGAAANSIVQALAFPLLQGALNVSLAEPEVGSSPF